MSKTLEKQVMDAYADCHSDFEVACKIRNLHFRADETVLRDEAKRILEKAKVYYNNFEPSILDKFPKDCEILIAREGSVCLYVFGSRLPSAKTVLADEKTKVVEFVRYWWD